MGFMPKKSPHKPVVAKFGGTAIAQAFTEVLKQATKARIAVFSAPGKSHKDDTKTTDLLYQLSKEPTRELEAVVVKRLSSLAQLSDEHLARLRKDIQRDIRRGSLAYKVSRGEYFTARIAAEALGAEFIDAHRYLVIERNAKVNQAATDRNIRRLFKPRGHYVTPGFYGTDWLGNVSLGRFNSRIRLLKRNGSDRSAAIIASALKYDYDNWTDVNGVYTAGPNVVNRAKVKTISSLTLDEVRELGNAGSTVLDRDTILDLHGRGVTTRIRNIFDPTGNYTEIVQTRPNEPKRQLTGIAARDDLSIINVKKFGMNEEFGYAARVLSKFVQAGISLEHMPTSTDVFSAAFHHKHVPDAAVKRVIKAINSDRRLHPDYVTERRYGILYLVGQELNQSDTRAVVLDVATTALRRGRIAIEGEISNPSSPSIVVLIAASKTNQAVRLLHRTFFESR